MIPVKYCIRNLKSTTKTDNGMKNMSFQDFLDAAPYSWNAEKKRNMLNERIRELTVKHSKNCQLYRNILSSAGFDTDGKYEYDQVPFLPVRLFKDLELKSVDEDEIFKTMTSSGTTGQSVSKIFLDRDTSINQQKAMVKIVSSFTGSERMPMLIIDSPSVLKNRAMFSARGAGILGFSMFGREKLYALNDDMELKYEEISDFLDRNNGKKILVFGFTFMIWQHFYKELKRQKRSLDLSNGIMIHGGGWKKLKDEAVSSEVFRESLYDVCGIQHVSDYYGMVEQTGCIYMECECGHLHASIYSDIITRRVKDFSIADYGEKGIIEVVSTIPESYPGHVLLTEDEGVILGEDDCPCGRLGKYFAVHGRLKNAEIRGCSDTYGTEFGNRILSR